METSFWKDNKRIILCGQGCDAFIKVNIADRNRNYRNIQMNSLSWYFSLYYKFRDYPITELNSTLKPSELKALYAATLRKTFSLFQLEHRKEGQIQGLISKNNYDLMLNKKVQNNLAQQQALPPQMQHTNSQEDEEPALDAAEVGSVSTINNEKSFSQCSRASRDSKLQWVVELSPQERNMDVFYELMIKMIRVSFRRLMVQNFALDRYGMHISKDALKDILQATTSECDILRDYHDNEHQTEEEQEPTVELVQYPPTTEQIKYEFLKYCISSKVYNHPRESVSRSPSQSQISLSQNQAQSKQIFEGTDKVNEKPSIPDNQIEALIVKVSEGQTSIFNKIIDMFQRQMRNNEKNKNQMIGIKNIAQSILDFALKEGKDNSSPLMFENTTAFRRNMQEENENSLGNSNILLSTWFDLILFKEDPITLLEIIEELVKLQQHPLRQKAEKEPFSIPLENLPFYYKVSSYLHLLILNSTKNIFIQSLLKINYLLVVSKEIIGGSTGMQRPFRQIFFKHFQEKKDGKNLVFENILLTFDAKTHKNMWREQAMQILLKKWKIIANVITQLCAKDNRIFFVAVFEKSVTLLDEQLTAQVELIEKLMNTAESIEAQASINPNEKATHTVRALTEIAQQIIGFGQDLEPSASNKNNEQKILNINNIVNSKSEVDRYRESAFSNREEQAEELSKWSQIITQNIFVYKQYKINLELISKLFKANHVYVALWFTRFHAQTKLLVRKLPKQRLVNIFNKFHKEMPSLWNSMTTDNIKMQPQSRFRRERGKQRNRISSIKLDKNLTLIEKKAIVFNYMLKAELQLYSHYMLMDHLNNQKHYNQLFDKQGIDPPQMKSRPQIFKHPVISQIILFSPDQNISKKVTVDKVSTSNFHRRTYKLTSSKMDNFSCFDVEQIRTMGNIRRNNKSQFEDLLNAIHHFEKPMDLQLDLDNNWKQKFGEQEIQYLAQLNDYIRYLNQINYLYQFWGWLQVNSKSLTEKKISKNQQKRVQLLNGCEYQADLNDIDQAFEQIHYNKQCLEEILMKTEPEETIKKQQLSEMQKRLKVHNKELYMIIQAIVEGENYFKLIGANLIGRDKNSTFKGILEDIMTYYQHNRREKTNVKMLEKLRQSMHLQCPSLRKQSSLSQQETQGRDSRSSQGRKQAKKGGTLVSHFEFAPEYYKVQAKVFRLNCIVAALEVDNNIFKNIKHSHVLSEQKLQKLTIIGKPYYQKLEGLLTTDKIYDPSQLTIGEDALLRAKTVFERKLLLLLITLIKMNYTVEDSAKRFTGRSNRNTARVEFSNIPEEHLRKYPKVLSNYTDLLKHFLFWRIKDNIQRVEERQNFQKINSERDKRQDFNVCAFLEEVLQLTDKNEDFCEEMLLLKLEELIEGETNLKFSEEFRKTIEEETVSLQVLGAEEQKVEYLRKKLSYMLMREMYFTLNYEDDFLYEKSVNAKKNYRIYEERILKFFQEIIQLDYQDYTQKKELEIKKRSIHLRDYELKYEQQPKIAPLQKQLNQLLCCLFNQLLTNYTTKIEQRLLSSKNSQKATPPYEPHLIYTHYCASQYSKNTEKEPKPIKKKKNKLKKKVVHRESISSIFAQMFLNDTNNNSEAQLSIASEAIPEPTAVKKDKFAAILIYTKQKFEWSQSLKVYFKILGKYQYSYSNVNSERARKKYYHQEVKPSLTQQPIKQQQITIMKQNQASLVCLLKTHFLENIHKLKCKLIRRNLVAGVQRLYIDLDVRHKVFESFKDRILNYELQKAKIYHQYMDYIRGLKLDVYSHMAGQDSLPYLRAMHAVKLYRLNVKKTELEQRVNRQFQKNLRKWNEGIQDNLSVYNNWLLKQQNDWSNKQHKQQNQVNNLLQIYHAILRQTQRHNRMMKKKVSTSTTTHINKQTYRTSHILDQKQRLEPIGACCVNEEDNADKKFILMRQNNRNTSSKYFNTRTTHFNKFSATASTKLPTKCEKITLSNPSIGLRGLSIKYDVAHFAVDKQQLKQRQTEVVSRSGVKLSPSPQPKGFKRYQSAQKFRPKDIHI